MKILKFLLPALLAFACESQNNSRQTPQPPAKTAGEMMALGDSISSLAGQTLLKKLQAQLEAGGEVGAISFCNVHAYPTLDSVARENNCQLKRISQRFRNPNDAPENETDRIQLADYESQSSNGETLQPVIMEGQGEFVYYRPIVIAGETCLKCHGDPATFPDELNTILKEKYPEDLATGYKVGDFRGAWKIRFAGNQNPVE